MKTQDREVCRWYANDLREGTVNREALAKFLEALADTEDSAEIRTLRVAIGDAFAALNNDAYMAGTKIREARKALTIGITHSEHVPAS